jgi:hypothetical protein
MVTLRVYAHSFQQTRTEAMRRLGQAMITLPSNTNQQTQPQSERTARNST